VRVELTRCYRFPAAHVLARPSFSREENERIFGKCANPAGHGHNYGVEVTVSGAIDADTGRVAAPELLDEIFDDVVRQPFSHRMLNDLPRFADRVPTAETVAQVIYDDLGPAVAERAGAHLVRVRVVETARNSFEVGEPR
jgi:6-pyruvoyltetrahydropterin/6-carboxytetrahydropterin synthase